MFLKLNNNPKLRGFNITQLEYLESSGTQYIDTGIKPTGNTEVICKFHVDLTAGNVFGSRTYSQNKAFHINHLQTGVIQFMYGTNNWYNLGHRTNEQTTLHLFPENNKFYGYLDDDKVYEESQQSFNGDYSILIYGVRQSSGDNYDGSCRIFEFEIKDNGITILHFIPALSDNVPCMYDTVSGTFFYNQGTGDFIAGPVADPVAGPITSVVAERVDKLFIRNCPLLNGYSNLKKIYDVQSDNSSVVLSRVRVDIGDVSGSLSELLQYAGMAGFNDAGEEQVKPRLVGTWTINDWYTTAQLAQAQAAFDGLTVVGDTNISYDIIDEHTIHILSTTVPSIAPVFITSDITKIYIGAGSSSSDDNTLMSAFSSDSKWSSYSSLLDTWYNYLHPTT